MADFWYQTDKEWSAVETWTIVGNAANFIIGITALVSIFFTWQSIQLTKNLFVEEHRPWLNPHSMQDGNAINEELPRINSSEYKYYEPFDFYIENIGRSASFFTIIPEIVNDTQIFDEDAKRIYKIKNCDFDGFIIPGQDRRVCGGVKVSNIIEGPAPSESPYKMQYLIRYGFNSSEMIYSVRYRCEFTDCEVIETK